MAEAKRDQNYVPSLLGVSNADGVTPVAIYADPTTHRLLVDLPGGGGGTVETVAVATANGFAGASDGDPVDPVLTLSTTVTGLVKGNGTALSAAVANTDYQIPVILTTTGTSGAASFNGTTLNIPQYQAAGSYALVGLSNLAGVAINTTLVSDTDNTDDLGTSAIFWRTGYFKTSIELGATDTTITRSAAGIIAVEGVDQVNLSASQTLTNKTLTSPAITTATLSGAQQLAEGASVRLDQTLSADGTYSGITIAGTAGATLAFGDLIYLAAADSRWELTDADSVTTAGAVLTGMCVLAAASDGDPTVILLQGNIRADANFPALTVGANVYASTTPGDVTVTAPSATDDVVHVIGKALTTDSMYFNPSMDFITIV